MKFLLLFVALLIGQSATALEVFKSTTDGFWPENSENLAITTSGEVWFNKKQVGLAGVEAEIRKLREENNFQAIVIQADEPLNENSEIVQAVSKKIEVIGGVRVYFVR